MASLGELEGQLAEVESSLGQYDANLPSEIESQIQKAYTPALQRSLDTTKNLMSDYGQRYFDVTTMGPGMAGTTAKDLAPTQKLGVMGRELGTMAGNLQSSQQFSDYLGGQMSDMYSKALQASQMGQQNLADKYSRLFNQYQMAWEAAEAEKNRALQRSLAAQQIAAMNASSQEEDIVIETGEGGEDERRTGGSGLNKTEKTYEKFIDKPAGYFTGTDLTKLGDMTRGQSITAGLSLTNPLSWAGTGLKTGTSLLTNALLNNRGIVNKTSDAYNQVKNWWNSK
jgi:hypothetical protein